MSNAACLNCGGTQMYRPLIALKFQEKELYICPQCLPTLIHKPYQLADKLPDFTPTETPTPDDH
jgi:hypothetical protein